MITFTYNYLHVIGIVAFTVLAISFFLSENATTKNDNLRDTARLHTTNLNNCVLILTNTGEVKLGANSENYQLQSNSRFSFIGCWLVLSTSDNSLNLAHHKKTRKQLFIFKDSISKQDFSRIANVINQL